MAQVAVRTPGRIAPGLGRDLLAGVLAGQVAGLVMAVAMIAVFTLFLDRSPFFPVQVIGSFVFGDAAVSGFHGPAFVAGLVLHQLGPSLFWGALFGLVAGSVRATTTGALLAWGLAIGALSQIVDVNMLLPPLYETLHGHNIWAENVPDAWSWVAHLVYGAALACYGWFRPRVG